MKKTILLIAALAFSGVAAAQYRWIDQNGRVQYGDTPPPGAKTSTVRSPSSPSSPAERTETGEESKKGPPTIADKEADFRKRQQEAAKDREKQAQTEQAAADKRANCARAKEGMRTLATGRVARVDANGERRFLDEAEIAQETARAQRLVQEWCS